jgi:hypothetical protein
MQPQEQTAQLKTKPIIKTHDTPEEILVRNMNDSEIEAFRSHLLTFKRSGLGWGEYRKKVKADLLPKIQRALTELRIKGFYCDYADDKKIYFLQIVEPQKANKEIHRRNCRCGNCTNLKSADPLRYTIKKIVQEVEIGDSDVPF